MKISEIRWIRFAAIYIILFLIPEIGHTQPTINQRLSAIEAADRFCEYLSKASGGDEISITMLSNMAEKICTMEVFSSRSGDGGTRSLDQVIDQFKKRNGELQIRGSLSDDPELFYSAAQWPAGSSTTDPADIIIIPGVFSSNNKEIQGVILIRAVSSRIIGLFHILPSSYVKMSFNDDFKPPKRSGSGHSQEFKNYIEKTCGLKLEFIAVKGGIYEMGTDDEKFESPSHMVKVKDFYLAATEVTNEQFCVFLNDRAIENPSVSKWYEIPVQGGTGQRIFYLRKKFTVWKGYEQYPVIFVSWKGAMEFCSWLSEKTGREYRLPSESEWEYAAGGGAKERTIYAGTSFDSELGKYARVGLGPTPHTPDYGPKKVSTYLPNQLGLYEMSGNVSEWCLDCWNPDYKDAPGTGVAWLEGNCGKRVTRSGNWLTNENTYRISYRTAAPPEWKNEEQGFRICRSAE